MNQYVRVAKTLGLAPVSDAVNSKATVTLQLKQPADSVTIVVIAKTKASGNIDITPQINGKAITAKKVAAVTDDTAQFITLDGIFPPDTLDVPGANPSVLIENKASKKATVAVHVIARSSGN